MPSPTPGHGFRPPPEVRGTCMSGPAIPDDQRWNAPRGSDRASPCGAPDVKLVVSTSPWAVTASSGIPAPVTGRHQRNGGKKSRDPPTAWAGCPVAGDPFAPQGLDGHQRPPGSSLPLIFSGRASSQVRAGTVTLLGGGWLHSMPRSNLRGLAMKLWVTQTRHSSLRLDRLRSTTLVVKGPHPRRR